MRKKVAISGFPTDEIAEMEVHEELLKAPTIKDVARRASVSPIVVSKVLHNKGEGVRVSDATAERVRKAALDLNYRVNLRGRILRERRTMMIGVLNGHGMDRPHFNHGPRYFAALMDGIVEGAFQHGYSVALCPVLLGQNPEVAMNDGRFDGLVWYSIPPTPEILAALSASAVPVVIIHGIAEEFGDKYPTVVCDNAEGIGLGVDHLYSLGHRKIGFAVESDTENVETRFRLKAFKEHMHRVGLPLNESSILDFPSDRKELHRYLNEGPEHTAIICHADGLAAEMVELGPLYGLKIPRDLSIIGFDSTEFCDLTQPGLTSISQPLFDEGKEAVASLIEIFQGKNPLPLQKTLPCGLDVRGSTGLARL